MSPLDQLLETYRTDALSERERGAAFDKPVAAWLVEDSIQPQRFESLF